MYADAMSMMCVRSFDQDRQTRLQLFHRSLRQGRRGWLWSGLTGRSRCLFALKSVEDGCKVLARSAAGRCTVPIRQIIGSESRVRDFDRHFHPLQTRTRERWLSVAAARQQGKDLPPVALIRVGEHYFVLDGHHRVSVAKALGQLDIAAAVEIWHVDGPLPWDTPKQAPNRGAIGVLERILCLLGRLQREGAQLEGHFLSRLSHVHSNTRMAWQSPAAQSSSTRY
jgi:hypothetical protein